MSTRNCASVEDYCSLQPAGSSNMVVQVDGNLGSACTASSQVGARAFRVIFLLLLHVIMLLLLCANEVSGKTVMVGGLSGWTNYDPKLDATPNYQEWAASLTIEINDTLVFSMPYGGHTIDQFFDANAFAACNFSAEHREWAGPNITMFDATLKNTGQYYFACAIPGHCLQGQKLSLFVYENIAAAAAATTTTTTAPAPAPAPQARAPQQLTRMRFQQPTSSPLGSPISGPALSPLARPPMPAVGYPIRSPVVAPAGSPKASRRLVRSPAYAPAAASRGRPIALHAGRVLHLL